MSTLRAEGPFFDELEVGQVFDAAPSVTLSAARAATHQAILGDRLRLALDDSLAERVTGAPVAPPSLVWNVAIGQSTLATHHVKANLFYRNLALLRQPAQGDTLRTTTTVVGLRENSAREGRAPTGLAALHMETVDQLGRPVLDFYRCAMLPLRGSGATGQRDDLDLVGAGGATVVRPDWSSTAWRSSVSPSRLPEVGDVIEVVGGDVVSSAPELARLTTNVAAVHHDRVAAGGGRLVYGGHTIGLALAQVTRAIPDVATVLAWDSCDHTGPVREGDTLRSTIAVLGAGEGRDGWRTLDLRSQVSADAEQGARAVLDWRFTVLVAG